MTEPVSLAQIKTHLRLDAGETDEDADLTGAIVAARRRCELRLNRSVIGGAKLLVLDAFPARATGFYRPDPARLWIHLPGGTIAGVPTISYDGAGGTIGLDPATFVVDPGGYVAPTGSWPIAAARPGAVRIAYAVSPLDPDDLAVVGQAIRLLVGHWYANREGVVADQRGTPAELPLSVNWLLDPLRMLGA